jgi:hypothetical protein
MAKSDTRLCNWQIAACVLGVIAGLVPGISFTSSFWGLQIRTIDVLPAEVREKFERREFVQGNFANAKRGPSIEVSEVEPHSAAERSGFRNLDSILDPPDGPAIEAAIEDVRNGLPREFKLHRWNDEKPVRIRLQRADPELAAVWYRNPSAPIAAVIFVAVGLLLFATDPITPNPLWRSILVVIVGLGIVFGSLFAAANADLLRPMHFYNRWPTENVCGWFFWQTVIVMGAGLSLVILAEIEIRRRLHPKMRSHAEFLDSAKSTAIRVG